MFERYTESARMCLFHARQDAGQLGGTTLEAEHLLLGVAHSNGSATDRILARARLSVEDIAVQILARTSVLEPVPESTDIPFSADAMRALEDAAREAEILLHTHVEPEHLLLGLLHQEQNLTAEILASRGLHLDRVREEIVMSRSAMFESPADVMRALFPEGPEGVFVLTAADGPGPGLRKLDDAPEELGMSTSFASFSTETIGAANHEPRAPRLHAVGPLRLRGTTIAEFAATLAGFVGRPVIDQTGLTGTYDIDVQGEYTDVDALATALREQLGLVITLEPRSQP